MKTVVVRGSVAIAFVAFGAWSVWNLPQAEKPAAPASHGGARHIQPPRAYVSQSAIDEPSPGPRIPQIVPADDANLSGTDRIIGIVVDGQPRAYKLSSLTAIDNHLVHDKIGGKLVTVSFCDITGYARCFSSPKEAGAIELQLAGFINGELHFLHDDEYHAHSSPDLPYEDLEFTETSWSNWRKTHPTTDVYVGFVSAT